MSAWGDEYNQPLNGPGGSANDGLKAIGTDMRKISRKIAQLRKDAGQMGTQRDSPELRKQIHRTREEATATMQQVAAALKRSREDPKITGDADQRSSLHQLESDFNQLHQSYSSVLEETQAKMRENTLGPESLSHSQAGAATLGGHAAEEQSGVQLQFQELGNVDEEIMQESEQEAEQIARDAAMLRDMYRDIQQHVAEQGDSLRNMEGDMNEAVDRVENANKHLDSAADNMFAYRRKCCYFWSCLLVILAIVVGYLVYHFTNNK